MRKLLNLVFLISLISSRGGLDAQNWELKAVLRTDVSKSESCLWVETRGSIVADRFVVIESRDARLREGYEVDQVVGDYVLLKEPLRGSYSRGSRIFQ